MEEDKQKLTEESVPEKQIEEETVPDLQIS